MLSANPNPPDDSPQHRIAVFLASLSPPRPATPAELASACNGTGDPEGNDTGFSEAVDKMVSDGALCVAIVFAGVCVWEER